MKNVSNDIPNYNKDPDATLDYKQDWSKWLVGDTIDSVEWTVPDGLTKVNSSHDDSSVTIWLSGGTVDTIYLITCRITTAAGRINDRSMNITIKNQ